MASASTPTFSLTKAAQKAISSPLLEDVSIQGARGVLINITGGPSLTLFEVNEASTLIQEEAHEDAVHDAAHQVDSATENLRAAAGDLRQAAGEQRSAAGEIGESAADLRDAADRLAEGRSD